MGVLGFDNFLEENAIEFEESGYALSFKSRRYSGAGGGLCWICWESREGRVRWGNCLYGSGGHRGLGFLSCCGRASEDVGTLGRLILRGRAVLGLMRECGDRTG